MFNWNEKELEPKMFTKRKPHSGRNIDHTSPGLSVHSHHPRPGSDGMVPCAAALRYLQPARFNAFSVGRKYVPGDLDLWPLDWHSNSSERGTKHVCPVNLAQTGSAVLEIFHTQTNKQKSHTQVTPPVWLMLLVFVLSRVRLRLIIRSQFQVGMILCWRPENQRVMLTNFDSSGINQNMDLCLI